GVAEEELGADIVGSGIDLSLEVIQFHEAIGGRRMALREAGDSYPEPPGIRHPLPRSNELDEVLGVLKGVARAAVIGQVPWWIAAQCQDVLDLRLRIPIQDGRDLLPAVADTRQVRDRRQLGLALNTNDQIMSPLPRRTSRSVGDRDKSRPEHLQL